MPETPDGAGRSAALPHRSGDRGRLVRVGIAALGSRLRDHSWRPADTAEHFRRRPELLLDTYGCGANTPTRMFERAIDFVQLLENESFISLMERMLGPQLHIIAE